MTDRKEVKRWEIYNLCVLGEPMSAVVAGPFTDPKVRAVEVIAVEDHDRIVAELRAEVAQAKRESADAMSGCCDCPMFKAQGKTIARQAKVIEGVKSALNNHATRPSDALIQIREVIEKEGAKDE